MGTSVRQSLGAWGEQRACDHLESLGYQIRARNWRSPVRDFPGELDIIAIDGAALVVCEVKTRRGLSYGSGAEAVDDRKVRRLRRLAALWLSGQLNGYPEVRFDVIVVSIEEGTTRVQHLVGAL